MENLIYPTGLVIGHNGPDVSVALGNAYPVIPQISYDSADHHVKVYIEIITSDEAINVPWSHSVVFYGPPIESVSVKSGGMAMEYFNYTVNILLKGGPGITTYATYYDVTDMFTGKKECLCVNLDLFRSKPAGLTTSGYISIDCKMPDWVDPS